jgi:hypothetical protein
MSDVLYVRNIIRQLQLGYWNTRSDDCSNHINCPCSAQGNVRVFVTALQLASCVLLSSRGPLGFWEQPQHHVKKTPVKR